MEADEHDGEDDSAVLVNITASHPKYSVRRFRRRKCWKRKLNRLRMTIPDMMISGESVVTSSDGTGHHAARVQLQLSLESEENIILKSNC